MGEVFYTHIRGSSGKDDALRKKAAAARTPEEQGFSCCQCGVRLFKKTQRDAENHTIQVAVEAHLYEVQEGSAVVRAVLLPACKSCNSSRASKKGWFTLHRNCREETKVITDRAGDEYRLEGARTFLQSAHLMSYTSFKTRCGSEAREDEVLPRVEANRKFNLLAYGLSRAKAYLVGAYRAAKRAMWLSRFNWVTSFINGNDGATSEIEEIHGKLDRKIPVE
eukprot:Rhum_TRINITY_DN4726_c0_g1::Rhum_TRINITY_DN4726_c0_g1_i1::g.15570::m.15570